jgi:hypothetical protein
LAVGVLVAAVLVIMLVLLVDWLKLRSNFQRV